MDVRDSAGRWDALGSRDSSFRHAAMELIHQEVMRRIENIGPIPGPQSSSPPAMDALSSDLNSLLAHVLMLSKRCPYEDVRKKCICLLQMVQVGIIVIIEFIVKMPYVQQCQMLYIFYVSFKKEENTLANNILMYNFTTSMQNEPRAFITCWINDMGGNCWKECHFFI
ncbi:hypothetical protein PO909_011005 [Leuciscus waleckii]